MAYKLSYFEFRGKGEIIRLLFAHLGVAYEDVRIQRSDWPGIKPGKILHWQFMKACDCVLSLCYSLVTQSESYS